MKECDLIVPTLSVSRDRQKFHTPNLYTIYSVCNGINVSVAMSQRVGRREEGRVGKRETRTVRREGRRKGGRDKRRD